MRKPIGEKTYNKSTVKPKPKNLNELAARIHRNNSVWWHDKYGNPIKREPLQLLMLVVTELAEACEGIRRDLMDDHLPHRKMEEVELADAFIRLCDFAAANRITLDEDMLKPGAVEDLENLWNDKASALYQIVHALTNDKGGVNWCMWAIIAYAAKFKLDLWGAMEEKIEYNLKRADHTHAEREKAGGKRF